MIGSTVSHYEIVEKLGEGGMGVVYKATDTRLDRPVALKFLPTQFAPTEEERTRFVREAKAASSLDHPNICTVYEAGQTDDGQMFMAMAYYEGSSLKDLIGTGKMPFEKVMNVAVQIAEALKAANSKGIVHRDVKPGNIIITPDGVAKLLDFGLASQATWATLTRSNSTLGTAAYMAPEQATGEGADHRSDLWSLGVMMYEMLTGKLPFRGDHEAALLYSIVNEEPHQIEENEAQVPPELEHVIMRLLEKNPDDRYQSASEVLGELKRLERRSGKTQTVARTRVRSYGIRAWTRKWGVLVASLAIVALSVVILVFLPEQNGPRLGSYRYTPYMPGDTILGATWSPDGKSIAYLKMSQRDQQIRVSTLGSLRSTLLADIQTDWTNYQDILPIWSPDASKIYFLSDPGLKSIGVAGGDPVTVFDKLVYAAGFAPDNKTILVLTHGRLIDPSFSDSVGLFVIPPDGSPPRQFQNDPVRERSVLGSVPPIIKFSPDGSRIGLFYWGAEGGRHWILPWPENPEVEPRRIFSDVKFMWPHHFEWLPDSRRILLSHENAIWLGDTEDETMTRITASSGIEALRSVSPDGKRILLEQMDLELDVIELPMNGSPYKTAIGTQTDEYSASVSADGKVLAYVTERTGRPEIWVEEGPGQARAIVTPDDLGASDSLFRVTIASISPDGKRVAYTWKSEIGDKVTHLWVSHVEGGSHLSVLPDSISSVSYFCWSPDSKRVFARATTERILRANIIIPLGGGEITRLPDSLASIVIPSWSPDGLWIAVTQPRTRSHGSRIVLCSPDAKRTRIIEAPGSPYQWYYAMAWSRDSRTIYVADSNVEGPRLFAVDVSSGLIRQVARYNAIIQFGPPRLFCSTASLSRDGKGILVTSMSPHLATYILDGAL